MNRRHLVLAGAGCAAAAAGVALQMRRETPAAVPAAAGAPSAASAALAAPATPPEDALWQAKFTQPNGQVLAMSSWRGQPIVLNFWATWCPPCLKEMPEIDRFAKQFAAQGGRVLGLAVDNPSAVAAYLARTPVSYAIGLAGFEGTELSRQLGNSNGGLPFTVAIHRQGHVAHRRLGETNVAELTAWAATLG
jgi:thiol-disulfide isomerase/thioredoxin